MISQNEMIELLDKCKSISRVVKQIDENYCSFHFSQSEHELVISYANHPEMLEKTANVLGGTGEQLDSQGIVHNGIRWNTYNYDDHPPVAPLDEDIVNKIEAIYKDLEEFVEPFDITITVLSNFAHIYYRSETITDIKKLLPQEDITPFPIGSEEDAFFMFWYNNLSITIFGKSKTAT